MTALLAVLLLLLILFGAIGIGTLVERCLARLVGISWSELTGAEDGADVGAEAARTDPLAPSFEAPGSQAIPQKEEFHVGHSELFGLAFRSILGLVCYLWIVFGLKLLHVHWYVASILPALLGSFLAEDIFGQIRRLRFRLTIGFTIWITMILLLGASLADTSEGIGTPWVNSYGDLTWHLGMAASFAFGENFPPEYQIFSGRELTYPFFTSLLNASTLWIDGSFHSLNLTSIIIWVYAWTLIWIALDGERRSSIPWALLFGGGSYPFVVHILSGRTIFGPTVEFAHNVLEAWPWVPFFTTMWVPQRGTWLGLAVATLAIARFHAFIAVADVPGAARRARFDLLSIAILLGLAPLIHGHFILAVALYISTVLLLRVVVRIRSRFDLDDYAEAADGTSGAEERELANESRHSQLDDPQVREQLKQLFQFCSVNWLLVAIVFFSWLSDKAAALQVTWGWMPWWQTGTVKAPAMLGSFAMWASNAPVWLATLLLLVLLRQSRTRAIALLLAFGLFSIVQLTPWNWDQLKAFVALYLVSLSLLSERGVNRWIRRCIVLLLVIPAIVEVGRVGIYYKRHTVFTADDLKVAEQIRESTRNKAIIAGKPDHNSPVTISGRILYYGYEGTISSHGLKGDLRRRVNASLEQIVKCRDNPPMDVGLSESHRSRACPEHILWTEREKAFWKGDVPRIMFKPRLPALLYEMFRRVPNPFSSETGR